MQRRSTAGTVFVGAAGVVMSLMVEVGVAQQPAQIIDGPLCPDCRIVLESVAVLDGRLDSEVGDPLTLARTRDGRWLASFIHAPEQIEVFSASGRHLRTVGRKGEGPGEYQFVRFIAVGAEDSVYVGDLSLIRLSVLSPTFDYVRSVRLGAPSAIDLDLMSGGRLVASQDLGVRGRTGLPLRLVGADGEVLTAFGGVDTATERAGGGDLRRKSVAAVPGQEAVWSVARVEYRLELWGVDGHARRVLVRNVPWFEPGRDYGFDFDEPGAAPRPGVVTLGLDSLGRLWVPVHVPDERWEEALGTVKGLYGRPTALPVDQDRYLDTVVELIDPGQRAVVSSERFDQRLVLVGSSGYAWSYGEDDGGFPRVHIWRLRLLGRGAP